MSAGQHRLASKFDSQAVTSNVMRWEGGQPDEPGQERSLGERQVRASYQMAVTPLQG